MTKALNLLIGLALVASLVIICLQVAGSLVEWTHNNQQHIVTSQATVISKRADAEEDNLAEQNHFPQPPLPQFFATFLFGGSQVEFLISEADYEALAVGDVGELSYQGTRFRQFRSP